MRFSIERSSTINEKGTGSERTSENPARNNGREVPVPFFNRPPWQAAAEVSAPWRQKGRPATDSLMNARREQETADYQKLARRRPDSTRRESVTLN